MGRLKLTLIAISISSSLFFTGCSSDDESLDGGNSGGNSIITTSCSDGIQNQDETGVDCGGVCSPCPTPTPEPISFTADGTAESVVVFNAYRSPNATPQNMTMIAALANGKKLTINFHKPDVIGWSGGLTIPTLTAPDQIDYEVTATNGDVTIYSTANGNGKGRLGFLSLEYKQDGKIIGSFSGTVNDGNGNTIEIDNGKFDATFND